jgi:hypothetical protein
MRERARGYEVERKERETKREEGLAAESEKRRQSASLLGLEPRPATSTTHDRPHKREEAVCVFCRRHGADFVLYIATEKKKKLSSCTRQQRKEVV